MIAGNPIDGGHDAGRAAVTGMLDLVDAAPGADLQESLHEARLQAIREKSGHCIWLEQEEGSAGDPG